MEPSVCFVMHMQESIRRFRLSIEDQQSVCL